MLRLASGGILNEQNHQQRGLRQEAHEHLAPRAHAAECSADVHRRKRYEHACQREKSDQRDRVGCLPERQIGRKRGHDGRRKRHRFTFKEGYMAGSIAVGSTGASAVETR